jgi:dGTPase
VSDRFDRRAAEVAKLPRDPRSPAQRDRDRILYTPEFRRLAAVTQVVGSHETELFHNRLTHTLKVAQIARRMAERLTKTTLPIDPDAVEAAALAHDIGHPPFGHIAEQELDRLMVTEGESPDGFEGNAQSFRIVARLAQREGAGSGLNLTRATLQGVAKYPWSRATEGKAHRKYSAYASEASVFEWSRDGLKSRNKPTLEAGVMDWSDDVAYALHDLDDFFKAGFVPLDRLARDEPEQSRFLERTRQRWAEQGRFVSDVEWQSIEHVADSLFAEFPSESADSGALMARLVSGKANLFVSGLVVSRGLIAEDPDMRRQLDLLKSLTWTYVIEAPALAAQQEGQRKVVRKLFRYYRKAIAQGQRHVLPTWARNALGDAQDVKTEARVACDVVASLGEGQAQAMFARISGIHAGSVYEAISR